MDKKLTEAELDKARRNQEFWEFLKDVNKITRGATPPKSFKAVTDSKLPWNREFSSVAPKEPNFYQFKKEEHIGRIVLGDKQAVAYDKLVQITETLNSVLKCKYPDKYYTVDDVYNAAKTHVSLWGTAHYLGYQSAFTNLSTDKTFWATIGELGNFNPSDYILPNILIEDTERCTGRTTKLLFHYCSMLLDQPNKWITIRDHRNTPTANKDLANEVKHLLNKQGITVGVYEYRSGLNGEIVTDLKANLSGSGHQHVRNKHICSPRTRSTPEK